MPTTLNTDAPGRDDLTRAAGDLASTLPAELEPLARLAYNYRWSWLPGGGELFRRIDDGLFERVGENPVRLLMEARRDLLETAAADAPFVDRIRSVADLVEGELHAPDDPIGGEAGPVAFLCAEFGIHRSLHIYSGGLGVLAGDILKEASDLRKPYVGVGLLYSHGNFRQRIAPTGYQEDFWQPIVPERLPSALVTNGDGTPCTVDVPVRGRPVHVQIWRVDVGRTPLFLLDANVPENDVVARWITSRLYVGDRDTRLEQYVLLGVGAIRALEALGIDPAVLHLNEGHASFAPLELARRAAPAGGIGVDAAIERARARTVFTTHTPVPAGNEAYGREQIRATLGPPFAGWANEIATLGRIDGRPEVGMTSLGLRLARTATGVSELHGRVSRHIWKGVFGATTDDEVPIASVTNGVHLPTWLGGPMRELLDDALGEGWLRHADDPATWSPVAEIPDAVVWATRVRARRELIEWLRDRDVADRLARDEPRAAVDAAADALDPDRLTIGFARRVAAYKRLPLLYRDLERTAALLEHAQFAIAGKAHPRDLDAKQKLAGFFLLPWSDVRIGARMTFVEDYDMSIAARLVAGCDVWLNVPRPPWEASGTSGMKAAMNGAVNASVLDGWWAEAYDGRNGFAIGDPAPAELVEAPDEEARDAADAEALYDVLEREVVPVFGERDAAGVPRGWVAMVKASLLTVGPRFCATRMVREYVDRVYGN
ncbi:MAG TPA: alpha-glucan family phosphorylase [Actinomycetota bacterium]|nr:alpha-glucan family phosphorylase [Actinomycetota bacterium]